MLSNDLMTVQELWQLGLPAETTLAAGAAGLNRRVAWVTMLRASYPALGELGPDTLVLARMALARQLDQRLTVGYLAQQLLRAQVAGLVVDEQPSAEECALADRLELSVLVVPSADWPALERTLLRILVDREGEYARRESQIRQHLQELYARGGIVPVLNELAQWLGGRATLRTADGTSLAGTPAVGDGALRHEAHPILAGGRLLGNLQLEVPAGREVRLDRLYVQEAVAVCGVELLQHRARQETREQLGADLVEALLDGSLDDQALIARFRRMGYSVEAERRHRVLAIESGADQRARDACAALLRDLQWSSEREGAELIWVAHRDLVVAFCSFAGHIPERQLRAWIRQAAESPERACCSVGVSRVVQDIAGLREAVRQATEACRLGQLVNTCHSPYYYEDLGLYRLLGGLRDREELARFYGETLGPLAAYDREHKTDLVRTLDVFFAENANASSTARRLYVHRNTLNYRLQRIVEITGLDLNDAEARLALQLGLKIHHLAR